MPLSSPLLKTIVGLWIGTRGSDLTRVWNASDEYLGLAIAWRLACAISRYPWIRALHPKIRPASVRLIPIDLNAHMTILNSNIWRCDLRYYPRTGDPILRKSDQYIRSVNNFQESWTLSFLMNWNHPNFSKRQRWSTPGVNNRVRSEVVVVLMWASVSWTLCRQSAHVEAWFWNILPRTIENSWA